MAKSHEPEQEYGVPDAENPEWTAAEMRAARPVAEVFPDVAKREIARHRGPQKAPRKHLVSIRLDVDVLEKFRATGKGWQGRINKTLAEHAPRTRRAARPKRRVQRKAL